MQMFISPPPFPPQPRTDRIVKTDRLIEISNSELYTTYGKIQKDAIGLYESLESTRYRITAFAYILVDDALVSMSDHRDNLWGRRHFG